MEVIKILFIFNYFELLSECILAVKPLSGARGGHRLTAAPFLPMKRVS